MIRKVLTGVCAISLVGGIILVATPTFREVKAIPGERIYHVPGDTTEDVMRIALMGLCGLTLGFLWLISNAFRKLKVDENDQIIKPLAGVAASYFLLTLFAGLDMVSRFGTNYLTWRMPVAGLSFLISTFSLGILLRRLQHVARRAHATDATVKVALSDTSKPGPDIDLSSGKEIVK